MPIAPTPHPERQLAGFIGKFEPKNQTLIRALRASLRRRFPTAHEMVYDNYNFFVIGYSATERPSDAFISVAAAHKGASLCFLRGASLADPAGVLQGSGKQTRFIRCSSAAALAAPAVQALLAAAARAGPSLPAKGRGKLIIRSVSARQRPRRLAKPKR